MRNKYISIFLFIIMAAGGVFPGRAFCRAALAEETISVPDWAGFFNEWQYGVFITMVRGYFESNGRKIKIEDGMIIDTADKNYGSYGLRNLARICSGTPQESWPGIIEGHFRGIKEVREKFTRHDAREMKYEEYKDFLFVRLCSPEALDKLGKENLVFREEMEGVISVVVINTPDYIINLDPALLNKWNKAEQDIYYVALNNIRKNDTLTLTYEKIDDIGIFFSHGNSHFIASHALLVRDYPDLVGKYGALVAVPTRHNVFFYPVNDSDVRPAAAIIAAFTEALYSEGTGAVTPGVYWYYGGKFSRVPQSVYGDGAGSTIPGNFP
ncbi:MAG: hypothetical protein ABH883_06540 [Candidatus Omnitrophota bacterium]